MEAISQTAMETAFFFFWMHFTHIKLWRKKLATHVWWRRVEAVAKVAAMICRQRKIIEKMTRYPSIQNACQPIVLPPLTPETQLNDQCLCVYIYLQGVMSLHIRTICSFSHPAVFPLDPTVTALHSDPKVCIRALTCSGLFCAHRRM